MDDDYNDFNDTTYVDIYECSEQSGNQFGCRYEVIDQQIIMNVTSATLIVNNILNDYDNYILYYNSFIDAFYIQLMQDYVDWMFGLNGILSTYFVNVQNSNKKRDYIEPIYKNRTIPLIYAQYNRNVYYEQIPEDKKQDAINDFSSKYGYNFDKNVFIISSDNSDITVNTYLYVFKYSTIFDKSKLFPNILENVTYQSVTNVKKNN